MYDETNTLMGFWGIGAAPVRKPIVRPKPMPTKKPTSSGSSGIKAGTKTKYGPAVAVKPSENVKQHGKTLSTARVTAGKAIKAALKALNAAKAPPKKPVISPAKKALIGAALQQPQKLTPKQQQALAKQKAAATKAGQLAKAAAAAGLKAKKTAIELAKKATAQKAVAVNLRKKGATRIRGNVEIGAAPDPNNPGYLDDGSQDPAYFGDPTVTTDDMSMPSLDTGLETPMDSAIELPPPPPIDVVYANYETVGGIPYNGEKGYPIGYVGSLNYFTEKAQGKTGAFTDWYGYIFGGDPNRPSWPGDNPTSWVHVHGHHTGKDWWNNTDINDALTSNAKVAPNGVSYGPLVGNPAMPDFAGMRVDGQGRGYWLPQEAPDWVTFPLKQAAALTAKAEKEAADAAAKADAAALAKINADNALAQAQQDAANALAESQAASEQRIAQAQQETQAQQYDIDQAKLEQQQQQAQMQQDAQAQQLLTQQAQADMQQQQQLNQLLAQQAQQELETQRGTEQMLLEQARREQEYLAQHPEQEFAPAPTDEGAGDGGEEAAESYDEGGGEQGGDDGGFDADEGVEW